MTISTHYPISLTDKVMIDLVMHKEFSIDHTSIKGVCRHPLSQGRGWYNVWAQIDKKCTSMFLIDTNSRTVRVVEHISSVEKFEQLMEAFSIEL